MKAQFEEKTYESYFNTELARQTKIYFPLGQVQEGSLGFDNSAFTINRQLWKRLGFPFWFFPKFTGVELREIADEMEHFLEVTIGGIPRMKSNLLFQYKKPEYITKTYGKEWGHWNAPYYRYNIYQEQQNLLMHIDNHFGSKVFIVYASPALYDVNKLTEAYLSRQIINISNFRRASELNGHHRNTYIQSGRYSVAFSKFEEIQNFDLIETLENIDLEDVNTDYDNRAFVIDFRKRIHSVMRLNKFYSDSFLKLNEQYSKFEKYELLYSHLVLNNFKLLTGSQWLVKL